MPNHQINVGDVELISLNDNLPVRSPFVAFPHTTIEQWQEYFSRQQALLAILS